jgi:hypothetical protein
MNLNIPVVGWHTNASWFDPNLFRRESNPSWWNLIRIPQAKEKLGHLDVYFRPHAKKDELLNQLCEAMENGRPVNPDGGEENAPMADGVWQQNEDGDNLGNLFPGETFRWSQEVITELKVGQTLGEELRNQILKSLGRWKL